MPGSVRVKAAWCLTLALAVAATAGCSSGSGCRDGCRKAAPSGPSAGVPAPGSPVASGPAPAPLGQLPPAAPAARYGGQRTCPVMGDILGEMGEPIPVAVKGQTVYVCCKGCVGKVQRDPDKYLAIVNAERAGR